LSSGAPREGDHVAIEGLGLPTLRGVVPSQKARVTSRRWRRCSAGAGAVRRAGLVSLGLLALDSTKIAANASGMANRGCEQIAEELLADADRVDRAEDEQFGPPRSQAESHAPGGPQAIRQAARLALATAGDQAS
jgi:hypothetical protein